MGFEYYATPAPLTQYLVSWLKTHGWPIQGKCFEPCVGNRAIVDAIGHDGCEWETNDIDTRWKADSHDDMTKPRSLRYPHFPDWTISNFPFSLATPILRNCLDISRVGVAAYFRISFHEPLKTGSRRNFLLEHPPTAILYLPRFAHQRSRKTGVWTTDSVTSCWTIWIKDRAKGVMWIDTNRVDPVIVNDMLDGKPWPIIPCLGSTPPMGYIGGQRGQLIDYAPPAVTDALADYEPGHRAKMDELNGLTGTEAERRIQWVARWA